ncbi:acyl-ACP--UDP-N-acetylglucosamine O-acyltransferase [Weeksellaceae bacterium KMM 9713]|uniref:Acyl-ACP--UDP-N-acetylglucosamine O-acyltransferase n=1 Tax=Profundicola chukchiensis TaxID=2961959 RepID=A0A9X4MYL8_9FLAO|nr:acyl-ACP--UDP-N-acetylglucosamine O-acyltransferase [Profundicola chukchiensis]MDG4945242.1 acyl-ACP--UDP-N-acetylglucosamine O-acyltransferase [Profundicola chukchiensis]MDG4950316.1 acyl-ACP--UDP-N-acetylglucosamine O-acyltransferase [Profundicola chukchiensis]
MNQPLAYVHPNAKLAKNVVVEPFASISSDVEIGEGTWIGPNVTIMDGARIGKNCKIFPGSVISAEPQDLKYKGEETHVFIGDNTVIRECVTINKGTEALGYTQVGSNCLIMATVHIAHDCIVGDHVIIANNVALAGHVEIDDYVIIGGMSPVHQFTKVGKHAMIAGGTLVRKDVPPYVKAARDPISYVGINSIGLRRRGFESEKIAEIQSIYRILFQKKLNVTQAVQMIETEMEATPERDEILQFLTDSSRGVMRGYNPNGNF